MFREESSVSDYKTELSSLNTKVLTIDSSICNLDAVISSLQSSTQTQEDKITSLDTFHQATETFIAEAERIDNGVAELINKRKKEFYGSYTYLKPNSEKEWWEKGLDWLGEKLVSVGEWCKENWKVLVTIAIVIVAVALLLAGVGGILAAMAIGALIGAALGGIIGGVASALTGGSIFEGIRDGAFTGAIAGIIAGGMAFTMAAGLGTALTIGAVSGAGSSLVSDLGDIFITGADITPGQVLSNMLISGAFGTVFGGAGRGLSTLGRRLFSGNRPQLPANANNIQKGNFGEMTMDRMFASRGYKRISPDRVTDINAPTRRGVDGVYYKPGGKPPYIIGEAKFNTSGLSKLKDGTPQMSDRWIEPRLYKTFGKDMARKIINTGYERVLVKVDYGGNTTQSLLNASGAVIK